MVAHGDADGSQAERDLAVLGREAVGAHPAQHFAQFARPARTPARAVGEGRGIRIQRPHLLARQRGEHGPPGGGEVGGKSHADIRHERGPVRCALLDDVEHVAPGHHGEVGALAGAIGEGGQQRSAEARERLLTGVAAGELERGGAEAPAALRCEVHDEAVLVEGGEQVVDGRSRDAELRGEGGCRDRTTLPCEEGEDPQRLIGRGNLRATRRRTGCRCLA